MLNQCILSVGRGLQKPSFLSHFRWIVFLESIHFGLQLSRFRPVLVYDMHKRKFHQPHSGLKMKTFVVLHQSQSCSAWPSTVRISIKIVKQTWYIPCWIKEFCVLLTLHTQTLPFMFQQESFWSIRCIAEVVMEHVSNLHGSLNKALSNFIFHRKSDICM